MNVEPARHAETGYARLNLDPTVLSALTTLFICNLYSVKVHNITLSNNFRNTSDITWLCTTLYTQYTVELCTSTTKVSALLFIKSPEQQLSELHSTIQLSITMDSASTFLDGENVALASKRRGSSQSPDSANPPSSPVLNAQGYPTHGGKDPALLTSVLGQWYEDEESEDDSQQEEFVDLSTYVDQDQTESKQFIGVYDHALKNTTTNSNTNDDRDDSASEPEEHWDTSTVPGSQYLLPVPEPGISASHPAVSIQMPTVSNIQTSPKIKEINPRQTLSVVTLRAKYNKASMIHFLRQYGGHPAHGDSWEDFSGEDLAKEVVRVLEAWQAANPTQAPTITNTPKAYKRKRQDESDDENDGDKPSKKTKTGPPPAVMHRKNKGPTKAPHSRKIPAPILPHSDGDDFDAQHEQDDEQDGHQSNQDYSDSEDDASDEERPNVVGARAALIAIKRCAIRELRGKTTNVEDNGDITDVEMSDAEDNGEAEIIQSFKPIVMMVNDKGQPAISYKAQLQVRQLIRAREVVREVESSKASKKSEKKRAQSKYNRLCKQLATQVKGSIKSNTLNAEEEARGLVDMIFAV